MTENDARLKAWLRAGPPEEDTYVPRPWSATDAARDVIAIPVPRVRSRASRLGIQHAIALAATAVAASLVLLVGFAMLRPVPPGESAADRPSEQLVLAEVTKIGLDDPRLVGQASTGRHTVTFVVAQRMAGSSPAAVIATLLWNGATLEEASVERHASAVHARVLGRGVFGEDDVETVQHGFLAVWTRDERVAAFELVSGGDGVQRGPVTGHATIVAVDERFAIDGRWQWRLLDAQGRALYEGGDPLP